MIGWHEALLFAAVATPLGVAALWLIAPLRRLADVLTPLAPLPALGAALLPVPAPTEFLLPGVFTGMVLGLDALGRALLLLTGALWAAAGVFARGYLRGQERGQIFNGFWLLTMAGNIGVTIAADAVGFYLFFVLMTFSAYALIVHDRSVAALRAGRVYIVMAVLGESALLAALLMLAASAESLRFATLAGAMAAAPQPLLLGALFAIGFGVKAGVFPLHVWLPLAHPVAPTPASALLSGAMIKAGLLGWLRFLPLGAATLPHLGMALIVAGLASALLAVVLGLGQRDAKTVLAYSSVSQIGYMAIGVGAALLSVEIAAAALLAVTIYALHHAFAKAALFLAVGILPTRAYGAARRLTLAAAALPALALAGAPLTSGALAKGALKSGAAGLPEPWPWVIDPLLLLAATATTLLMARFLTTLAALPGHDVRGSDRFMLAVPWVALLLLSTAAAFWLPSAYRPPAGLDLPGPFDGIGASFWPVALGAALGFGVWQLRHRLGYFRRTRVPAGDVAVGIEAAGRRLGQARVLEAGPLRDRARRTAGRVRVFAAAAARRLTAHDAALGSGGALGLLLLAIIALLGTALLLGG